jgi:putative transposase
MKGKRYTTEDKIRILREADRGEQSVVDVCREENISEVSFHRWKKPFGHMEINAARRLKELERENRELKQMLADSLLKNRVLEAVCEKKLQARDIGGKQRERLWQLGCALGGRCAGIGDWRVRRMAIAVEHRRRRKIC